MTITAATKDAEETAAEILAHMKNRFIPQTATSGGVDDAMDAQRYRTMRGWFVRDGRLCEIDPLGHIRNTTNEVVDAGVDALTAALKDGGG